MRRLVISTVVAAALAASGCGEEAASDRVEQAQTQAEEAVERLDPQEAVEATDQVVEDVTGSARELAGDPDADVDARLTDAEERARDLAGRVEGDLAEDPELAAALRSTNERLADAAAELQDATTSDEARRVIEDDLSGAADGLRDAAGLRGDDLPQEARRQLEQSREQVADLQQQLPDLGP